MKISIKLLIGAAILIGGAGITYHMVNTAPTHLSSAQEQAAEIIRQGKCAMCHTPEGEKPFYDGLPVIGTMMNSNITKALKQLDMTQTIAALESGDKVNKVDLAKIEKAISDETMPLVEFNAVHWGAAVTPQKKEMIMEWVKEHRAKHYSNGLAAAEFANEPVQPIVDSIPTDSRKVALGTALFHDTRLSLDNTISCASCHGLNTAGVDNKQFSEGVGGKFGGVNAPTVYNSAFNMVQFWDGRAETLAHQAAGPPTNPVEMASPSWQFIVDKLNEDKTFAKTFAEVYPDGLSEANITDAIGEFEKTLITPNSAFDRYLKGDKTAITAEQAHGYQLFKDNKCATCHVGQLMGGQSFELMGMAKDYFVDRIKIMEMGEEDNGRFKETKLEKDKHRFKVPTLRNVALTTPYFHDGTVTTLEEAVAKMALYQTNIELKSEDIALITDYLTTLTGEFNGKKLESNKL